MSQKSEDSLKRRVQFDETLPEARVDPREASLEGAQQFTAGELIEPDSPEIPVFEAKEIVSPKRSSRLGRWVVLSGLVLIAGQTGYSLWESWQAGSWLFGLKAAFIALGGVWIGRLGWQEYRKLKQLKGTEDIQAQAERLRESVQQGEATRFLNGLCQNLPQHEGVQTFYQMRRSEHTDAEQLTLFDGYVLNPLDEKAKAIVHRYSLESSLLLAASPVAVLDIALILWRNQRMIRELAECYGIELGYWSRIRLLRLVVGNILYAGVSEAAIDLGSQYLSMEMTGKVSARIAQGLGGGMLTARLGYQAMALCRPLTFTDRNRPRLGELHGQLLQEVKKRLLNQGS
ncbi:YcjF family protein [Parendozoicomonas haliclonae]|uniref:Uncharacterized protein n=1 Tax=Parendozoicomonas haliclonae TaxID=1960125 RepID=A0A1X7ANS8_9GAMM|nr:TIGR01620 family protein [Parendozoicomonas haliclonae]SMA49793.1 hypothetical protein EHSB41UT_03582 [Parendozoicomonas haliclonae]